MGFVYPIQLCPSQTHPFNTPNSKSLFPSQESLKFGVASTNFNYFINWLFYNMLKVSWFGGITPWNKWVCFWVIGSLLAFGGEIELGN